MYSAPQGYYYNGLYQLVHTFRQTLPSQKYEIITLNNNA